MRRIAEGTAYLLRRGTLPVAVAALTALAAVACRTGQPSGAGATTSGDATPAGRAALAASPPLPPQALRSVADSFEAARSARYMEQDCAPAAYPGWEGLPTQRCRYSQPNHDGTSTVADVILLDASPGQLARWVVASCMVVTGSAGARCTTRLSRHIIGQSGAQFPVAGVVLEDINPDDGRMEAYCFRDGVTVEVDGFVHRDTLPLGPEQIERCMTGPVTHVFVYARIQSTTREQYRANGGTVDVGTSEKEQRKPAWLDVSRAAYQAAWGRDRNELMIAWLRADL